jgi:hypothetical protein
MGHDGDQHRIGLDFGPLGLPLIPVHAAIIVAARTDGQYVLVFVPSLVLDVHVSTSCGIVAASVELALGGPLPAAGVPEPLVFPVAAVAGASDNVGDFDGFVGVDERRHG